jgi:hypothetical protein
MRYPRHAPRGWCAELDLSAEGLRVTPPVRAEWARARERLPSYPETSSRNPRTGPHVFLFGGRGARVPFRLLSTRAPRQAVLRASSRLAPWIRHEVSRPPGFQDARCVRSTSATRTTCVHPHLARSRLALATFAAWTLRGVLGSAQLDRGSDVSRRPGPLRRIVIEHGPHVRGHSRGFIVPEVVSAGVLFPRCTMRPSL